MRTLAIITVLILLTATPAMAAMRLAVINVESPELAKVAALVELELLKLPDTEAVDRANLAAVLKEQQLVAALATDAAANRIALGRILKAEVLIALRSKMEPAPHACLIVFETKHGLRLRIEPFLPTANPDKDASALLSLVKKTLARARLPIREVVAVPPFVSNDLAFERQSLGKPLAAVVEEMLFDRPGIAVVELAEAKALSDENTLVAGDGVSRPLPLYLLGEYRHDGYGPEARVTVELAVKRGTKVLGTRSIKDAAPDEVAALVRREAAALLDQATGAGPPLEDAATEARQLAERATRMFQVSAWIDCLELAEASLLLKPDQVEMHLLAADAVRRHILAAGKAAVEEARGADRHKTIPAEEICEAVARSNASLARRALPHFEYYLVHSQIGYSDRTYEIIAGFFHWCRGIDLELRDMFIRVLKAKQTTKQNDDIAHFLVYCQQDCFAAATDAEKWQWKLDVAEHWPLEATSNHNKWRIQVVMLHSVERNNPQLPVALKKLKAMPNPAVQQVARTLERRLANGWELYRDVPLATVPQPQPAESNKTPVEDAEARFRFTGVTGRNTGEILGWIQAGPGIDALWSADLLFLLKDRQPLPRESGIRINAKESGPSVCYDGRYVWAFRPGPDDKPALLAIDPVTSEVETITTEHGLPPMPLEHFSLAGVRAGLICVVGHFGGRAWIGLAAFEEKTKTRSLSVFHEAREMPAANDPAAWKNPKTAFRSSQVYTLSEKPGSDGKSRQRVFVHRGDRHDALLVDPETRAVEVLQPMPHFNVMRTAVQSDGAIYWVAYAEGGWKVHRFGFPTLKPEVYSHPMTQPGALFVCGNRVGHMDNATKVWIADKFQEKFRELRTDEFAKHWLNTFPQIFDSGHFGPVITIGSNAFAIEVPAP